MARNDYHVIVYQILAYLYQCLKCGSDVNAQMLEYNSRLIKAGNETYWNYIMWNMHQNGLIDGVVFVHLDNLKYPVPQQLGNCQITPIGIEYLCDNSFMEKAKKFLKEVKEITPFI